MKWLINKALVPYHSIVMVNIFLHSTRYRYSERMRLERGPLWTEAAGYQLSGKNWSKGVHGGWRPRWEDQFLLRLLTCMDRWKTTKRELPKLAGVPFLRAFPRAAVVQKKETSSQRVWITLVIFPHCTQMGRQSHRLCVGAICKHSALHHSDNWASS